ncbi:class I SAM-dependent methyltransferase [Draconibacterium sp. IB214405]|uniref:O-methyltransferase n=1 Tax=Draconibacterium sp. IB214405 TaxID=3097352 RepID=UPI002A12A8AF|nr:class I SAM-dependent methyltransferase [Draconibacterium sp. IB214405]MDX8338596.1 class I SAM-dependent methyltransferase [Draconibacterium sp. IB214405]
MNYRSIALSFLGLFFVLSTYAQYPETENSLDKKIKAFLENNASEWRDMNVPLTDGKILYDIIVENGYTSAVEIGTSTGHSAIWIAWALSKTGGKLITIEIDKTRYLQAKANFKKAGVSKYIDVRLADAHEMVPKLKGEFDFVFCDADKYWYKNYFIAMDPKMKQGACFTAHNTSTRANGIGEFLRYVESLDTYDTTIDKTSRSGISKSFKK